MAAVLLGLLSHETNVGHVTGALPVKLTIGNAVLNDGLKNTKYKNSEDKKNIRGTILYLSNVPITII